MVDQRFHRLVDTSPWWRRDLLVLQAVVAGRHLFDALAHHVDRLAGLVEAHRVTVEAVAIGADDDVEVELVVLEIRHVATEIPGIARTTQDRTGHAQCQALFDIDGANALQALTEDRLAGEQLVKLVEQRRQHVHQFRDIFTPPVRQVDRNTAGADVVVIHAQAGDLFEDAQRLFTQPIAVEHHRHGADVHAVGGLEEHVG